MAEFLSIHDDKEALTKQIAEHWVDWCKKSIKARGYFYVALSGGSTPKSLYQLLATAEFTGRIEWSKVVVYFGDERCVAHDHPESNYLMARQTLLDNVGIPEKQIYAVPYLPDRYIEAAVQYQQAIEKGGVPVQNGIPQFDLVLLGLGDDGHTASLFPGTPILDEQQRWIAEVYVQKFDSWRVSMTYPVINNAVQICIMVAGDAKAKILKQILGKDGGNTSYPISKIQATGEVYWMVDNAAVKKLLENGMHDRLTKLAKTKVA